MEGTYARKTARRRSDHNQSGPNISPPARHQRNRPDVGRVVRRVGPLQSSFLPHRNPLAMPRDARIEVRILDVQVVGERLRILAVAGKHLEMGGNGHARADGAGQVRRLLKGHVADAVCRQPPGVAAVDRQKRGSNGLTPPAVRPACLRRRTCRRHDRGGSRCLPARSPDRGAGQSRASVQELVHGGDGSYRGSPPARSIQVLIHCPARGRRGCPSSPERSFSQQRRHDKLARRGEAAAMPGQASRSMWSP